MDLNDRDKEVQDSCKITQLEYDTLKESNILQKQLFENL